MVADASGGVVFANAASARLLHVDALRPAQPFTEIFPDADRIARGLERCRAAANAVAEIGRGEPGRVALRFESPLLDVELEPLYDPSHGYLGAVAVIRPPVHELAGLDGSVLAALADALKTPMASILGYSDLLARGVGLNPDQLDRYLQRIDANLARMQVNLENLLTVIDAGAERLTLTPVRLDAGRELRDAVARAQPQLREKSLTAAAPPAEGVPPLSADPGALEQILDNLLGTGNVGLSVVRILAENMGGAAWAEGRGGQTRFRVRLPRARFGGQDEPAEQAAGPSEPAAEPAGPREPAAEPAEPGEPSNPAKPVGGAAEPLDAPAVDPAPAEE
jgi:signal transduction histidine kinase